MPKDIWKDRPDISVIISTFNRKGCLRRALQSLSTLPEAEASLEVIISDDGSDDGTSEEIKDLLLQLPLNIYIIRSKTRQGIAAARNKALKIASGHFLVFTDDDCFFEERWLSALLKPLRRGRAAISGGPDIPPSDVSFFRQCMGFLFTSFIGTGGLRQGGRWRLAPYYPKGCNMAVQRNVIESVGGFDEEFGPGEEIELVYRAKKAGFHVAFVSEAVVIHDRQLNFVQLLKKVAGIGHIRMVLAKKHFGLLYPGHMIPFLGLLGLMVLSLLALFFQLFYLLLVIVLLTYAVLLLIGALTAVRYLRDIRALFVLPGLFGTVHAAHALGYGWGVVQWFCSKRN